MTKKKINKSTPEAPSDDFELAWTHAGSLVIDCEFCGRVHFALWDTANYDEGELEDLQKNEKANPDKYISHSDTDSISWGYLDGHQYVYCCPCHSARRYEDLFWQERYKIMDYFQRRSKDIKSEADRMDEKVKKTDAKMVN